MKKRFDDYNLISGLLPAGAKNGITDVPGVKVGHVTKIKGKNIRTGLTLIDPGVKNLYQNKIPAAIAVGNGFGKLAGLSQVEELGTLETPIVLTNTLAVGPAMRGVVQLILKTNKLIPTQAINAVVGETNDGFLNDIQYPAISSKDVLAAYRRLTTAVEIGNVGAGTGTRAFSWKGGIGQASRVVRIGRKKYVIGVLVQTNFGGALTIAGVSIGQLLGKTDFDSFTKPPGDGSCMVVIATDAPLTARQLKRISQRAFLGLARTGSVLANGSGDYAVAFSTQRNGIEGTKIDGCLPDEELTKFFLATVEAVEESVFDALFAANTMTGRAGNRLAALPREFVIKKLSLLQLNQ